MISPSSRAAVCHVGDSLAVMCNTNENVVDWNIAFAGTNDRIDSTVTSTTLLHGQFISSNGGDYNNCLHHQ